MRDGGIVGQGGHDEFIAACGARCELYRSRLSGPASAEAPAVEGNPLLAEVERDSRDRSRP